MAGHSVLNFTEEEKEFVVNYFLSQSENATVNFVQKVYAESVLGNTHSVWDLHASDGRWWIITEPTNLYLQDQFPNMDLALTFHMGLCLRIPQSHRNNFDVSKVTIFGQVLSALADCERSLSQAHDAGAYRTIGVRCRETLLAFIHAIQDNFDWPEHDLQRSNFNGWVDLIGDEFLPSPDNKERRRIFKSSLKEASTYVNWLTHSKSGTWVDAEIATNSVSYALGMATSIVMRQLRGVPDQCPKCESGNLNPEEGFSLEQPEIIVERPVCSNCGWTGDPVVVGERSEDEIDQLIKREGSVDDEECAIMTTPLMKIIKPSDL